MLRKIEKAFLSGIDAAETMRWRRFWRERTGRDSSIPAGTPPRRGLELRAWRAGYRATVAITSFFDPSSTDSERDRKR